MKEFWQTCVSRLEQELPNKSARGYDRWSRLRTTKRRRCCALPRPTASSWIGCGRISPTRSKRWPRSGSSGRCRCSSSCPAMAPRRACRWLRCALPRRRAPRPRGRAAARRGAAACDGCADRRRFQRGRRCQRRRRQHRVRALAPEHRSDLRKLRDRQGQPTGPRRRAAGGREPRHVLQPAVPVRRRGPGQDPPDPRHRQRHGRGRHRGARALRACRPIRVRRGQGLPAQGVRRFQALLPFAGPAADRRHPVLLRQEPHAGRVLLRLRGDGGAAQADHHHQRHVSEGTVGHRQPPDLALRFRPDGGDRAARAGNAGGDPAAQGRVRGRAHARGSGVLHRQASAQQRPRTGRRAAQGAGVCPLPRPRRAHGGCLQGSAEGPAVGVQRPDHGREHPEDRGGLLQDQGGRHVFETPARQYRLAAPGRHVPGQGADPEKPAGNR